MTYNDGLNSLSRSETYIVKMNLDTLIVSGDYITHGEIPSGEDFYPCVTSVDWIPSRAESEGGIGYFGEVVIKAKDFPWEQGNGQGSFFGRMIANNPYYLNRKVDIYVGFYQKGDTFSLSNFQKRTYFLKRIDGPDEKGNVKIYASDVVSRLKEAEVPKVTEGVLNENITDTVTAVDIDITDTTGFDSGGGYAIIEDEIINYSAVVDSTDIVLSGRGYGGTVGAAHSIGDPVRNIYRASGNVVDVIRDIIEDFTDIDHASYINDTDWNSERDGPLASETVEIWITEPTPCDEVIDKLCKQSYINVWWDDAAQELKLKAIGPTLSPVATWTDDGEILDARVRLKRDQKKILTSVWLYYGKRDQTRGNEAENFDYVYVRTDTFLETSLGEAKVKKVFADTLPDTASGTASKVTSRLITQNKVPIEFSCHVDAVNSTIEVGDAITILSDLIQGTDGQPDPTIMRVIEKAQKPNNRYFYKLIKTGQEAGSRYALISDGTLGDYLTATEEERNTYGWICDTDLEMSNGDDPYIIQ